MRWTAAFYLLRPDFYSRQMLRHHTHAGVQWENGGGKRELLLPCDTNPDASQHVQVHEKSDLTAPQTLRFVFFQITFQLSLSMQLPTSSTFRSRYCTFGSKQAGRTHPKSRDVSGAVYASFRELSMKGKMKTVAHTQIYS